ncbi:hypothetical protein REPUB_Repub02eG0030700 [Reevesia pubescens]
MALKSFVREIGNISKKCSGEKKHKLRRGRAHIALESSSSSSSTSSSSSSTLIEQGQWEKLPPELLLDIIQRVETRETCWPGRRDVVACASVCRSWRQITKEIVKTPEQCALSDDLSKLLLVAKKVRRTTSTDFVISLVGDDFSRSSNNYVGRLSQPTDDSTVQSRFQSCQKTHLKWVSPRILTSNYNTVDISYELNVLRTKGPRRIQCTMHSIPIFAIEEGGTTPTPVAFTNCLDKDSSPLLDSLGKRPRIGSNSTGYGKPLKSVKSAPLVLKNKAPRWHEQLQCWCLNFKGRVTVASVKNFQLVAAVEPSQNATVAEQEKVILQFGKIGKDIFTMDYHYPLSAFQAFAICLSSFDTKPVCE